MSEWPVTAAELERVQDDLARRASEVELWRPSAPLSIGAVFVVFSTAPAKAGGREQGWAAAALFEEGRSIAASVARSAVGADYVAGYLALREGPLLDAAVRSLGRLPDVMLVNASGRDHPRRAGLALHLGAVLEIPSVGVTDRPLLATGPEPGSARGSTAPLELDGEIVGHRVRTRRGARAVCAHAAWRTDADTAREVLLASARQARTPEPLRDARRLARSERARDEGRAPPGWIPSPPRGRRAGNGRSA